MKQSITISLFLLLIGPTIYSENFTVDFIKITSNVWIHRSYEMVSGFKTPSNGLIIEAKNKVILIDTAWNNEETNQIITFVVDKIHKPIDACFITHFHQDRAGGVNTLIAHNVRIYMNELTYDLLGKPQILANNYIQVNNQEIDIDNYSIQVDYLGPAHSKDNITIWDPVNKLLFGGCLLKSLDSKTLGNIADADLVNWPEVLKKLKKKYNNTKLVIPGHGEYGDIRLIEHTYNLFK